MAVIDGIAFDSSTGRAIDGATAKLWEGAAFPDDPPTKGTALPSAGFLVDGPITTGSSHGSDGAYRFEGIPPGAYWISVEINGEIGWESAVTGPHFDPLAYGAVGDGATDDTEAVQAAITAAGVTRGIVNGSGKTYKVTSTITLGSNVHLRDLTLDASSLTGADNIVEIVGTSGSNVSLTSNAVEGGTVISGSITGLASDDWIRIASDSVFGDTSQPRGEIARIESVAGSAITLYDPLADSYATADDAIFSELTFVENVRIERVKIIGPADDTLSITGIEIDMARDVVVSDCTFVRTHWFGVAIKDSVGVRVDDCYFDRIEKTGLAYGVGVLWASHDVTITGCVSHRLRHLVTIGGGAGRPGVSRRVAVTNCTASQSMEAGFDCHPGGEEVSFVGNHVFGSDQDGIVFQGGRGTIVGNTVRDVARHGINLGPLTIRAHEYIVDGNVIHNSVQRGILLTKDADWDSFDGIVITNNTVSDALLGGIEIGTSSVTATNVVVSNNTVVGNASHGIILNTVDGGAVTGNYVEITAASVNGIRLLTSTRLTIGSNSVLSTNNSSSRCILTSNVDNSTFVGNVGSGAGVGILLDSTSTDNTVCGNNMNGNTVGFSLSTGTNNVVANNINGVVASVASAATIALPASENSVYNITGTTTITSITALNPGRIVTLKFAGALTFTDGSNLILAGGANFTTAANSTINLMCDGTNWYEISRSSN